MALIRQIPAELHEEILHLLPSNNLVNFRRVCKDWNQLISSQRFIQKHLHRSRSGVNGTLIAALSSLGIILYNYPIGKKIRSIPYPPGFSLETTIIVGSCDGLVCLVGLNRNEYALINPSTGKWHVHTTDGFVFNISQSFWFGQHPSTGEYLIVVIKKMLSGVIHVCQISNKLLPSQHFSIPQPGYFVDLKPFFLHGALHWYGYKETNNGLRVVIFAYDILKNKLLEVAAAPSESWYDFSRFGIVDGCLFVIISIDVKEKFVKKKFELWIMKEYGVEESWTKYSDIEGFQNPRDLYRRFMPDEDLLGNYKTRLEYKIGERNNFLGDGYTEVFCVDSLVSPSLCLDSFSFRS